MTRGSLERGRQPPPQASCVPRWLTHPHQDTVEQKDACAAHALARNNTMPAGTPANGTGKAVTNPAHAPLTHSQVFLILLLGSQVH